MAVDAVITWVDGSDPAHRRKLAAYLGKLPHARPAAADATRFDDSGEIEYCIASLLRFAPWLGTIFIVSDAQSPALLQQLAGTRFAERVRVVDHREIFRGYERYLPTFSNRAIEAMLWRIPGLAEHFLYLNDDFQLIQPVAVEDFFSANGVVLRGRWRVSSSRRRSAAAKRQIIALAWRLGLIDMEARALARPGNHTAQQLSARMAGYEDRYFQVPHCPHPARKSVLAEYFAAHPAQLEGNLRQRLRSSEQFLTLTLANHLELRSGSATIDNRLRPVRLKPASQWRSSLLRQLGRADRDPSVAFACVQSLDLATASKRALILAWLDRRVGRLATLIDARLSSKDP